MNRESCGLAFATLLITSGLAAQSIQASLTALQPITLSQNGGSTVTHPAGPLTSANLALGNSSVTVDLTQTALGWNLESDLFCNFPPSQSSYYSANSDMELALTASAPTKAIVRIYALCQDDGGGSITVTVPGYGTVSFFNGAASGQRHVEHYLVDLGNTPLTISVDQAAGGWPAGVSYLSADVELLSPLATPEADACGGVFVHGQLPIPYFRTDHFLDLVDNASTTSSGTMRARGLGQWSSFFVGFSSTLMPLALPAPFATTCPTLGNIAVFTSGTVTETYSIPSAWELTLPLLPPGLTLYAQHGCAKVPQQGLPGNILWNTSNVLRIDT